jgi:hypothetical protein
MSELDKNLESQMKKFLELDEQRKKDPTWGQRNAENALMAMCDFMKVNRAKLDGKLFDKTVAQLQAMNLVRYRSYCREHLLDIGITNV